MVTGAAALLAALYGLIRLPETRTREQREASKAERTSRADPSPPPLPLSATPALAAVVAADGGPADAVPVKLTSDVTADVAASEERQEKKRARRCVIL